MESFPNVFQPPLEEILRHDHPLKGQWCTGHFQNENPLTLELGCGKGEYSVGLARRYPGRNFIGVDIKGARIWTGARQALEEKIENVAFIRSRIECINAFFAAGEVDEIWLTFPDPQLKKRRQKKRLSGPRFLNLYREFLKDGALIHLKTDNKALYRYTLEVAGHNRLEIPEQTEDLYGSRQAGLAHGIQTFYEKQFIADGLPIHYLRFRLPRQQEIIDPETDP